MCGGIAVAQWWCFLCLPPLLDLGDCEPPELPEGVLLLFELDLVDGELVLRERQRVRSEIDAQVQTLQIESEIEIASQARPAMHRTPARSQAADVSSSQFVPGARSTIARGRSMVACSVSRGEIKGETNRMTDGQWPMTDGRRSMADDR